MNLLTPSITLSQLQVVAELDANQGTATQFDIVFVYEKSGVALLPPTGPAWFSNKAALVAGLANNIEVVSLQVPPGTVVDVPMKKSYAKAVKVIGFANYISAGGQPAGNLTN